MIIKQSHQNIKCRTGEFCAWAANESWKQFCKGLHFLPLVNQLADAHKCAQEKILLFSDASNFRSRYQQDMDFSLNYQVRLYVNEDQAESGCIHMYQQYKSLLWPCNKWSIHMSSSFQEFRYLGVSH